MGLFDPCHPWVSLKGPILYKSNSTFLYWKIWKNWFHLFQSLAKISNITNYKTSSTKSIYQGITRKLVFLKWLVKIQFLLTSLRYCYLKVDQHSHPPMESREKVTFSVKKKKTKKLSFCWNYLKRGCGTMVENLEFIWLIDDFV